MRRGEKCVLLFSGGRDSTLAALRLASAFDNLVLVTVTSEHLIGIDAVRQRLAELASYIPRSTRWLHISQPSNLPHGELLQAPTCLPCHRAYAAIGVAVALQAGARSLAFGYTAYQSDWVEQTPEAIARLQRLLGERGIDLVLPVYDVASKAAAIEELTAKSVSSVSLEQKCLQQQFNVQLTNTRFHKELYAWEQSLAAALAALPHLRLHVLADLFLGDLHAPVRCSRS
jgi:PP-loop superfamily ATP-utilizing enzyme